MAQAAFMAGLARESDSDFTGLTLIEIDGGALAVWPGMPFPNRW